MNSGVRIIKRDHADVLHSSPRSHHERTGRQNEREIACTVKNWIAELVQRRTADELHARTRFFMVSANNAL